MALSRPTSYLQASKDNSRLDPWDVGPTAERQALMPRPALQLRHLRKSYESPQGTLPIITGLDLEIAQGELVCVVGPNGCGKTTLLRLLAGMEQPTSGQIVFHMDGQEAEGVRPYLLQQEGDLFPWLTIRQNILLGRFRSPLSEAEYQLRMMRYVERMGLQVHLDQFPHQLSGGKRQRVSILRSFLAASRFLLMDEPFAHLDPHHRRELQKLTLEIWQEEGHTLIFVTHDIQEAIHLGDRVLLMDGSGQARLLVVDRPRPRDPWDPGVYSRDVLLREVLDVLRAPRRPKGVGVERTPETVPPVHSHTVLAPLLVLGMWEVLARAGGIDIRFFPAPSQILKTLGQMALQGDLFYHWGASVARQVAGLTVGGVFGVGLGLVLALSTPIRRWVEPLINMTYPIPKLAILPFLMLVFGFGEVSKVVTLAIGAFFLLLLNTQQGVQQVRTNYRDTLTNLHLQGLPLYFTILLKGASPAILTGIRAAAGYCLVLLVAAEMTGTTQGLGYLIWHSWELFNIDQMYAGLFMIALTGALTAATIEGFARRQPWIKMGRDRAE